MRKWEGGGRYPDDKWNSIVFFSFLFFSRHSDLLVSDLLVTLPTPKPDYQNVTVSLESDDLPRKDSFGNLPLSIQLDRKEFSFMKLTREPWLAILVHLICKPK
jgi:hypothetical protein